MTGLVFIAVAILLYVIADQILRGLERRRGERFEQRTIIFFFLLLGLALVAFPLIQRLMDG